MVNFNIEIIKDNRYDYLFKKLENKYGSLETFTKNEIESINNMNNISKNKISEINLVGGQNSESPNSNKIINYYRNYPFLIFNLSIFLLISTLVINFVLNTPEVKKIYGEDTAYIFNILTFIIKGFSILNINICLFFIYFNNETINNFKNKSILSYILVLLLTFTLIYFYYYQFINLVYNNKLQGLLIPMGVFGAFVPVYHLYEYTVNYFSNKTKNTKDNLMYKYVKEIKNLYINAVDLIPELIYIPLPNIPKINSNTPFFSHIRNGIQSLKLSNISTNYEINVVVPKTKLAFVNFPAILCCLGIYIKKLAKLVYDKIITPIGNIILPIWDKILNIFQSFIDTVIKPVINFINSLVEELTRLWNNIWWGKVHPAIVSILNFLKGFLNNPAIGSLLQKLDIMKFIDTFNDKKNVEKQKELRRKAEKEAEINKMTNAKKLEKAASKKAVENTLKDIPNSKKKLNTLEQIDYFINKSQQEFANVESIQDPISVESQKMDGGQNINIILKINNRKRKYIKNYYKRLDNIVKINYPKPNEKQINKKICDCAERFKNKMEEFQKNDTLVNLLKKNEMKKIDYKTKNFLNSFNKVFNKYNISPNVSKNFFNNFNLEMFIKTPKLCNVMIDIFIIKFKHNVKYINKLKKLYKKTNKTNKKDKILKEISNLKLDNNDLLITLYPLINDINISKTNNKNFKNYFSGNLENLGKKIINIDDNFESEKNNNKICVKDVCDKVSDFCNGCVYNESKINTEISESIIKLVNKSYNYKSGKIDGGKNIMIGAVAGGNILKKAVNSVEEGYAAAEAAAAAAAAWAKKQAQKAFDAALSPVKSLLNRAQAPINTAKSFFGDIENFFTVQIGQNIANIFNKIKNFFKSLYRETTQIISDIGSFLKKYIPLVNKIISNVFKIVKWFIVTVLKKLLKVPRLWIDYLKLLLKTVKKLTQNDMDETNKSKEGSNDFPPLLQSLMTIVDLPFGDIFNFIENIINKIASIFDFETIESLIENIKSGFNAALDIFKKIPCVITMPLGGLWSALSDAASIIGIDARGALGDLATVFDSVVDFNNNKCYKTLAKNNKSKLSLKEQVENIKKNENARRGGKSLLVKKNKLYQLRNKRFKNFITFR